MKVAATSSHKEFARGTYGLPLQQERAMAKRKRYLRSAMDAAGIKTFLQLAESLKNKPGWSDHSHNMKSFQSRLTLIDKGTDLSYLAKRPHLVGTMAEVLGAQWAEDIQPTLEAPPTKKRLVRIPPAVVEDLETLAAAWTEAYGFEVSVDDVAESLLRKGFQREIERIRSTGGSNAVATS